MNTPANIPPPRTKRHLVYVLRLWAHGRDKPDWIGEVQDIQSGDTVYVQGLEALFNFLKQKTDQNDEVKQEKL
jgi:hypothetical protein